MTDYDKETIRLIAERAQAENYCCVCFRWYPPENTYVAGNGLHICKACAEKPAAK
jgi:hypothetical protein